MDDEIVRAANAKKGSPFLNTDQAAYYVGLSRRTLEKMRTAGGGPRFRKHGRYVRYHIDDLNEWSAAPRPRSPTVSVPIILTMAEHGHNRSHARGGADADVDARVQSLPLLARAPSDRARGARPPGAVARMERQRPG